jgi:hypothetical protein
MFPQTFPHGPGQEPRRDDLVGVDVVHREDSDA